MSIKNFIPTLWAEKIAENLKEYLVAWEFCNHEYEGELKKAGDSVRIQNVVRPTITTTTDGAEITNLTTEAVKGLTITMPVKRQSYFDYAIYDVDKAQKTGNLEAMLKMETTQGIANELDKGVLKLADDKAIKKLYAVNSEYKLVSGTAGANEINVLEAIDEAAEYLYSNNVPANEKIEIVVTPKFYTRFRRDFIKLDTNNSEKLRNGKVGTYGNIDVVMSNNVHSYTNSSSKAVDEILVRSKGAIAAVKTISETEAFRPESGFSDAVKGLTVWDCKVVRPKEAFVINVTY